MKRIWRMVVKVENFVDKHANGTKGTNVMLLDCGHTTSRKGSEDIPESCACYDCEMRSGEYHFRSPWSLSGNVLETWDKETRRPMRKTLSPEELSKFEKEHWV